MADYPQAPKERVNIMYIPATGGATEQKELPLKLAMLGDYLLREDPLPLGDRKPVRIDKENFNTVMKAYHPSITVSIRDEPVHLVFNKIQDFSPDSIVRNSPPLNQLLEIREALKSLRGPMGNKSEFRKRIEQFIKDPETRKRLFRELNMGDETDDAPVTEQKLREGE